MAQVGYWRYSLNGSLSSLVTKSSLFEFLIVEWDASVTGHHHLIEELRAQGVRITPQREMILLVLHEADGHLTAEEICERVRRQAPSVGVATIYRNLYLLKDQGIVAATDMGEGSMEWELTVAHSHHHMVCEVCGQNVEFEAELTSRLEQTLLERYGFRARIQHLAVFGVCAACRAQEEES